MRTILVTGAEGFVGAHLIQFLKQKGYAVVAGVRNRARKLAYEKRSGSALVCDVGDAINVARVIASARPDGVVHLAGTSRAPDALGDPLAAYQATVSAAANVLDGVRRAAPRARVLIISSCEVYGNAGSNGQPLPETTPRTPVNTIGSLRANAEDVAHTFFRNFHSNVSIVRPFHHTGPGQSDGFFLGAIAKKLGEWDGAAQGSQLKLPYLDTKRDILHVLDVVEAYEKLLRDGKPNEIYNVCSGQSVTIRDVVQAMVKASGKQIEISPLNGDTGDGETNINCLCGDNSKMKNELGWQPKHNWEEAARDLVRSYEPATRPINA